MDMVELENTESILPVEVKLVDLLIREPTCSNSKTSFSRPTLTPISHPGHFGKKGIRLFREHINKTWCKEINLDKIWTLLSEDSRKNFLNGTSKLAPVIDVTKSGFHKVCGRGRLPNTPVIVKARYFTEKAQRRIQAIGGACVLVA